MTNIYELLATEKQCKRYLMRKEEDGTCSYCVEGLIARTLNLPEYEWESGKYAFGDPETESIDIFSIGSSKIRAAGFPVTLTVDFVLNTLGDVPDATVETWRIYGEDFSLTHLNDSGITFEQFAVLFEALGVPHGH